MVAASTTHHGASPARIALFAASGFVMLCALVFLSPFAVSSGAAQNDVYMANLFIGLPVFVIGSFLFALSLACVGLRMWLAVVLAVINAIAPVVGIIGFFRSPISLSAYLAGADALLLLAISWAIARAHDHMNIWARGLLLALLGSGLMGLLYVLFGGHYSSFGDVAINWPPYLTMPMIGVAIGLAIAIFVIGWIWGAASNKQT